VATEERDPYAEETYRRIWGAPPRPDPLSLETLHDPAPVREVPEPEPLPPSPEYREVEPVPEQVWQPPRTPEPTVVEIPREPTPGVSPEAIAETVVAQVRPTLVSLLARMTRIEASLSAVSERLATLEGRLGR
jgi:hypothetical protein